MALALVVLLAACDNRPETPTAPVTRPVLSTVVEAQAASLPSFVGTVEPQVTVDYSFRVGGSLLSRAVDVGDAVTAGEVLATVESTTLELGVRSAAANLATAEAQATNAAANAERLASLGRTDNASQAEVEAAQQQQQSAQSAVTQAQSSLKQAQQQLSYATLIAEFDGVVTAVSAEPGEIVAPGQAVATVARPDSRDLVIDVPEALVPQLGQGTKFTVALQLDPRISVEAAVREIAPQADTTTRTRQVKLALADPPTAFWLGTTATATPQLTTQSAIILPISAILAGNGASSVWIVGDDGVVHAKAVTVEPAGTASVTVTSGLSGGERVVTAGVHDLTDGQQVRIGEGL